MATAIEAAVAPIVATMISDGFFDPAAARRLMTITGISCSELECSVTNMHIASRDSRYFDSREPNGKKVFWSRGNGWVIAGLARVLQDMPADYPDRARYVTLFKEMAEKVASLQGPDGYWRASLLDPASLPNPETSGTGFFIYSLAWGINQGLLDRATFEPAVRRGWIALALAFVDPITSVLVYAIVPLVFIIRAVMPLHRRRDESGCLP